MHERCYRARMLCRVRTHEIVKSLLLITEPEPEWCIRIPESGVSAPGTPLLNRRTQNGNPVER